MSSAMMLVSSCEPGFSLGLEVTRDSRASAILRAGTGAYVVTYDVTPTAHMPPPMSLGEWREWAFEDYTR